MPGNRSKGQTMIGCWCEAALVEKIDRARGARTRSQFCREAIAEKLRAMGFDVSETEAAAPDRSGKGGPKRIKYSIPRNQLQLNDSVAGNPPKPSTGGQKNRARKKRKTPSK